MSKDEPQPPFGGNYLVKQSTTDSRATPRKQVLILLVPSYLIATFLWDALTPAHEFPMRTGQVLSIAADLLAFVGVIALRARLPTMLFRIALFAGLGLIAIRVSSDASWWTGHLVYTLRR